MKTIDADMLINEINRVLPDWSEEKEITLDAITNMPTVNPDDTWSRWAKVMISVMVGVLVWTAVLLTVETFRRWGIL